MTTQEVAALAAADPAFQPNRIFTYLFLTIGPIKVLGPFAKLTAAAEPAQRRTLAFQAAAFATVGLLVAGFSGQSTLGKWGVSLPALILAGGTVLFLVAIRNVLAIYDMPAPAEAPVPAGARRRPLSAATALSPLAFPTVVTPYGVAVVILLLAIKPDETVTIVELCLVMMALDLIAMLFARPILRTVGVPLQLFGNVLNVLQVALAFQIFIYAIQLIIRVWPVKPGS